GGGLKRLPSSVYWAGLGLWEIWRFHGSQDQYHEAIENIYSLRSTRSRSEDAARRRGEGSGLFRAPFPGLFRVLVYPLSHPGGQSWKSSIFSPSMSNEYMTSSGKSLRRTCQRLPSTVASQG